LRKTDLAYIAGIIDGEGCIGIYTRGKGKGMLRVTVVVHNTNEWLCQWLRFSHGGSVHQDRRFAERNHKPCWKWSISGKLALVFLQLIFPYLRLKRLQAEIAIKFLEDRQPRHNSTETELAVAEAQRILMSNLNKTGVHPKEVL